MSSTEGARIRKREEREQNMSDKVVGQKLGSVDVRPCCLVRSDQVISEVVFAEDPFRQRIGSVSESVFRHIDRHHPPAAAGVMDTVSMKMKDVLSRIGQEDITDEVLMGLEFEKCLLRRFVDIHSMWSWVYHSMVSHRGNMPPMKKGEQIVLLGERVCLLLIAQGKHKGQMIFHLDLDDRDICLLDPNTTVVVMHDEK